MPSFFETTFGLVELETIDTALSSWRRQCGLAKDDPDAVIAAEICLNLFREDHNISDAQRAAIVTAFTNADFKKSPKAKIWVRVAVAFSLGLDLEDEPSKKRVRALIKEGALIEKEEWYPMRRQTAVFVRAA